MTPDHELSMLVNVAFLPVSLSSRDFGFTSHFFSKFVESMLDEDSLKACNLCFAVTNVGL